MGIGTEQHVFLVGAKSLGAYGGYETFVNKLTEYHQNDDRIKYHVACKANGIGSMDLTKTAGVKILNDLEFEYHNAHCFLVKVPDKIGSAQSIYYDCVSITRCIQIIKEEKILNPVVYIMSCRIGPFIRHYYRKIKKLGGRIYLNPDGHEWLRDKWWLPIKWYWKLSERFMVKYSDLVICDSVNIEKYIHNRYDGKGIKNSNPNTTFIAYGAEKVTSDLNDEDENKKFEEWKRQLDVQDGEYYLVVGRFVPENNYETMIREFMKSHTNKKFILITNQNSKLMKKLENDYQFKKDKRINFVGAVYDEKLLMKIRENAYGYLHGHEVGGTNPSLLEALSCTKLNLLLDVSFNKEVAQNTAFYWKKENGSLSQLIDKTDLLDDEEIEIISNMAKERISTAYSWQKISDRYMDIFLK